MCKPAKYNKPLLPNLRTVVLQDFFAAQAQAAGISIQDALASLLGQAVAIGDPDDAFFATLVRESDDQIDCHTCGQENVWVLQAGGDVNRSIVLLFLHEVDQSFTHPSVKADILDRFPEDKRPQDEDEKRALIVNGLLNFISEVNLVKFYKHQLRANESDKKVTTRARSENGHHGLSQTQVVKHLIHNHYYPFCNCPATIGPLAD